MENARKHTLLIVDDTPANLQVLLQFLHTQGFQVLTARSGSSALERARYGQPDLILLDVQMPGMDGFETCRHLKADPATQSTPIIFMTAMAELASKVEAFAVGAVDYIIKPFQFEEVLARVNTHLHIHDLTHRLEQLVAERTTELAHSLMREQELAQDLERALDKERHLGQLKSHILRVVSHEFRTPLSVISQSASILENFYPRLTDEKRQRNFARISEAVFTIDKLLANVALINLNESGELKVNKSVQDWTSFWTELQHQLSMKLPEFKRIQFFSTVPPATITTDPMLLNHIMIQLLANALHYSNEVVTVHCDWEEGNLVMQIKDSGIGIVTAEQSQIFDLFFRGSNVAGRRGLGAGLYLASQLAALLGGTIEVTSEIGQGSIFALRLPTPS